MRTSRPELIEILTKRRGATITELEAAWPGIRARTSLRHAIRAGEVEVAFDAGRRRYRYYVAQTADEISVRPLEVLA